MLVGQVRAWEGEEIEWKIIKVHPNQITKKKGRTSDYDILGRVWIRKSQKGDNEYFF